MNNRIGNFFGSPESLGVVVGNDASFGVVLQHFHRLIEFILTDEHESTREANGQVERLDRKGEPQIQVVSAATQERVPRVCNVHKMTQTAPKSRLVIPRLGWSKYKS